MLDNIDPECFDKFITVPQIITEWLSPYIDFSNSCIMDFGCGNSITAVALAVAYPNAEIYAVDLEASDKMCLSSGIGEFGITNLPDNIKIMQIEANEYLHFDKKFDLIYSWSAFEHIAQDIFLSVMRQIKAMLKDNGYLFTQIAPLYYSPFGSHLSAYIPEPWAHLTMQQNLFFDRLRNACNDNDLYDSMCSMYNTLNKITPQKLSNIMDRLSLKMVKSFFSCNKDYDKIDSSHLCLNNDWEDYPVADSLAMYHADVLLTEQLVYLCKNISAPISISQDVVDIPVKSF